MTPQEVIKTFMAKLINHGYAYSSSVGTQMLDAAVQASSRFSGIQNVIDSMKSDQIEAEREAVAEVLGSDYAGKTMSEVDSSILKSYVVDTSISNAPASYATVKRVIQERKAYIFLEKYCGIQLNTKYWFYNDTNVTYTTGDSSSGNVDTGAITGSDANITLKAGDVVYGTTLTAANMKTFAQQDGISLSGNTLIIGTGIEKTANSVVPEIGNKYTATTSTAQNINTGSNDWIVVTTSANDTIATGGADSIDAGAGNDKITVGADHASIITGAGNDSVEIATTVKNVTLEDLNTGDALNISNFVPNSAQVENSVLLITDKAGTRTIRFANYEDAMKATVNGKTFTNWLGNVAIENSNSQAASSSASDDSPTEIDGVEVIVGQAEVEPDNISEPVMVGDFEEETQKLSTTNANGLIKLDEIKILNGTVTAGNTTVGTISNEFPNISTFTKNGLTVTLLGVSSSTSGNYNNLEAKTLDQLNDAQKLVLAGLFKWWTKEGLTLINETYGLNFNSSVANVNEIGVVFFDSKGSGNTLASAGYWYDSNGKATKLTLNINMNYYKTIVEDDVNGAGTASSSLLDRTLSHEFTHSIMESSIVGFVKLPHFVVEGMAELTHGIDDQRGNVIFNVAADASKLNSALNLTKTSAGSGTINTEPYAAGYMFMRYFAKQAALQELVDYANPDSGESWEINKTTATYKVNGEVMATIKGLRSGLAVKGNTIDGITVKDGVITLSQQVVGTSTVTLSTSKDYTLALDDSLEDKKVIVSNKKWTVNNGTATLTADWTSGYTLSEDATTITYTAAKTNQTLATVTGLATTGVTASDFSTDTNVITLKGSMIGTSKISVKGDGYTLALAEDAPKPELILPYWAVSGTSATYKQDTSAGFTMANDSRSANYSKLSTATLATVSGLKAVTADNAEAIKAAISIDADKKITLKAAALGTSKVSVKEKGYTLALDNDVAKPTQQTPYWAVSGTSATYKQDISAGFTLASDSRSANYSKVSTATLATVSGIKAVTDDNAEAIKAAISIDADKKITLKAAALGTSKVSVKEKGYTLALDNDVAKPTQQTPYWAVSGTSATYKQDTSAGFTMANDSRSASYSKVSTATLATVSGLKAVTDDNAEAIKAAISIDADKKITLKADALGTSKVSVKGDGYTLVLVEDVKPKLQTPYWEIKGTTAYYKQDTSTGFTLSKDGKSASYSKVSTATLATISGLKAGLEVKDNAIDGITVTDNVITLNAKVLGTSNVKVTGGNYTLSIDDSLKSAVTKNRWLVNGTTASYDNVESGYFKPSNDNKTLTYTKEKVNNNLVTVKGLAKGAKVESTGYVTGIFGGDGYGTRVMLTGDKNFSDKVEVKLSTGYTLNSQLTSSGATKTYWSVKSGKGSLVQEMSAGYTTTTKNGTSTLTYSPVKSVTVSTISGLNKNLTDIDGSLDGLTLDLENKKIKVDRRVLSNSKVSVTGDYNLELVTTGNNAVPTEPKETQVWSVSGTKATYKNIYASYFTRKNDKTLNYNKEKTISTIATISGLKKDAPTVSFALSGNVITLTQDALPDTPNAKTKISLSTTEPYTLKLANGIGRVGYDSAAWEYSKGKAMFRAEVRTAGYSTSLDNKTIAYIPKEDGKGNTTVTTFATVSGVKSKDGITLTDNIITLGEAALNQSKVTLTTDEGYTLAINRDEVDSPIITKTEWVKKNSTTAQVKGALTAGYTVSDDRKTINYSKATTNKVLATIKGIKSDKVAFDAVATTATTINLNNSQLSDTVTVSGGYTFNFVSDYSNKTIIGTAAAESIAVAGSGVSVTCGKGNDYVDFTGNGNTFVYTSGDGDDVIADFTANSDKIMVTKGAVSVIRDGSDAIVKVDNKGSITLKGRGGQNINIVDKDGKAIDYTVASADLLDSDNFLASGAQLDSITDSSFSAYSLDDIDSTAQNLKTLTKQSNLVTYVKK